jgi:hypothetical protein
VAIAFRHTAGFGRRMEYWIIGRMLKEGLDVYVPLVDDFGIDAIIRKSDNSFIEVQIKARSSSVIPGDAALFAAIVHPEMRPNYYFVFYAERMEAMWIMSSEEFIREAAQNKNGKNVGKRGIWFNGKRKGKAEGEYSEHSHPRFDKYKSTDFSRFREVSGLVLMSDVGDEEDAS